MCLHRKKPHNYFFKKTSKSDSMVNFQGSSYYEPIIRHRGRLEWLGLTPAKASTGCLWVSNDIKLFFSIVCWRCLYGKPWIGDLLNLYHLFITRIMGGNTAHVQKFMSKWVSNFTEPWWFQVRSQRNTIVGNMTIVVRGCKPVTVCWYQFT